MRHVRMVPQHHLVAALAVLCFEKCGVCSVLKSSWKPEALVALALDALQPLAECFLCGQAATNRGSVGTYLRLVTVSAN